MSNATQQSSRDSDTAALLKDMKDAIAFAHLALSRFVDAPDPAPLNGDGGKLLLTVKEAAERLSVGKDQVYALIQSGDLKSVRVGERGRRIPTAALTEYVAGLTAAVTS